MLKLFLWLKYLNQRRIVFLSITAVALSVCLLVVVASLFTGFIAAFEQSAVEMIGDVILTAPTGIQFERYPEFIDGLERTEFVEAATATLTSEGLLHVGRGNVRPVSIWGIQPERRQRVTGYKSALIRQGAAAGPPSFDVPGKAGEVGGFVGIGVVAQRDEETDEYDPNAILGQVLGERILATTGTMDTPENPPEIGPTVPKRRTIPFYVADIVFTGVHELDSGFVYLPIEAMQKELYPGEQNALATGINVRLKPGIVPEQVVGQVRELWGRFADEELGWGAYLISVTSVVTAREMQSQFVAEFRKQMGMLLLIFGVISFSVVVLFFCIFYMMVKLKQRDVAVIKSCGATNSSVAWLFLGFGVTVGVLGSGVGAVLGYVITHNINRIEEWISIAFGLKLWKSSVYMFDKIPNEVDWESALPIVAMAIAAAALGALVPAIMAARTRPVEVLRYE